MSCVEPCSLHNLHKLDCWSKRKHESAGWTYLIYQARVCSPNFYLCDFPRIQVFVFPHKERIVSLVWEWKTAHSSYFIMVQWWWEVIERSLHVERTEICIHATVKYYFVFLHARSFSYCLVNDQNAAKLHRIDSDFRQFFVITLCYFRGYYNKTLHCCVSRYIMFSNAGLVIGNGLRSMLHLYITVGKSQG